MSKARMPTFLLESCGCSLCALSASPLRKRGTTSYAARVSTEAHRAGSGVIGLIVVCIPLVSAVSAPVGYLNYL